MYGFGDDANPRQDTVELVEDLMIEYIETIVHINIPVHPPLILSLLVTSGS